MHPNLAAKLVQVSQVGFGAMEDFVQRLAVEYASRGTILEVDNVFECLTPKIFRKTRCMEKCANTLESSAVEPLRNAVVLRSIVNRQIPLLPLCRQMRVELTTAVLATTITVELADLLPKLRVQPSLKLFVAVEGLVLRTLEIYCRVSRAVVGEGDIVLLVLWRLDGRWTPKVRMNGIANIFRSRALADLLDRFPRLFPVLA